MRTWAVTGLWLMVWFAMNLQFSSSVELNPMIDDELKLASAADEPSGGRGA